MAKQRLIDFVFIVDLERWDAGGCVVARGMGEQGASQEPAQREPVLCSTSQARPPLRERVPHPLRGGDMGSLLLLSPPRLGIVPLRSEAGDQGVGSIKDWIK